MDDLDLENINLDDNIMHSLVSREEFDIVDNKRKLLAFGYQKLFQELASNNRNTKGQSSSTQNVQEDVKEKNRQTLISLPDSGICPLCNVQPGAKNWARHCWRNHKGFILSNDIVVADVNEIHSFVLRFLGFLGLKVVPDDVMNSPAYQLAQLFAFSDTNGLISEGLESFEMIATKISMNEIATSGQPIVLEEIGCTAIVNGANLLGVNVGNFCTSKAVELARIYGVGFVIVTNFDYVGPGRYYVKKMTELGLEGVVFNGRTWSVASDLVNWEAPNTNEILNALKLFFDFLNGGDSVYNESEKYFVAKKRDFLLQHYSNFILSILNNQMGSCPGPIEDAYKKRCFNVGGFVFSKEFYDNIKKMADSLGCCIFPIITEQKIARHKF